MNDPAVLPRKETKTILLVWAIGATVAALIATGAAVWLFLQKRPAAIPHTSAVSASPFLDLPESVIPGNYKWTSKSGSESFITLNADRSFIGKSGMPNPAHRWELTRNSLVIFWLRSQNRLNRIERPGVYVEVQDGTEVARMEKQE
jgi:hypothetical protein